jgi:hypothetical protein
VSGKLPTYHGNTSVALAVGDKRAPSLIAGRTDTITFVEAELHEMYGQPKRLHVVYQLRDVATYRNVFLPVARRPQPTVLARITFNQADDVIAQRPWESYQIVRHRYTPDKSGNAGGTLAVELRDMLYQLDGYNRVATRKGNLREILNLVLPAAGIKVEDLELEPNIGYGSWVQSYETDLCFLTRILPCFHNSAGAGDLKLFVRDDKLWVATVAHRPVAYDVNYIDDAVVEQLALVDDRITLQYDGQSTIAVTYDPDEARYGAKPSNDEGSPLHAPARPEAAFESVTGVRRHVGQNREHVAYAAAQTIMDAHRLGMFGVEFILRNGLGLRVHDVINLRGDTQDPWGGFYTVYASKTAIRTDKSSSFVRAFRATIQGAAGAAGRRVTVT